MGQAIKNNRGWLINDCFLPFILSRLVLFFFAWIAPLIPPDPASLNQTALRRGWVFTPHRFLDVWARWDSFWYLRIIKNGYEIADPFQSQQSSIAFFPLYPYTVKAINFLIFGSRESQSILLAIGIVLSNLFLLGSIILLYLLIKRLFKDLGVAKRAIIYLLIFPTSFFLSSFYAEAMFLFFSLAAVFSALHRKWFLAGLAACLVTLTRPPGILILVPVGYLYFQSIQWKFSNIRPNILWFLIAPASFAAYFISFFPLTGSFFAPAEAQLAWGRILSAPWIAFQTPVVYNQYLFRFEQFIALFALVALAYLILKMRLYALGLYGFLLLMVSLTSGTMTGLGRHVLMTFPVFIVMAYWGKRPAMDWLIKITSGTLLAIFWLLWCRFYMII